MSKYITLISEWLEASPDVQQSVLDKARAMANAKVPLVTRRAALGGLAVLPATAGSVLAAPPLAESPRERCLRLADELSLALGETDTFDDWCLHITRPINGRPSVSAQPLSVTPEERVKHHLILAGLALGEVVGTSGLRWVAMIGGDQEGIERYCASAFEGGRASENVIDIVRWKRAAA
jgi:hypothetical protein